MTATLERVFGYQGDAMNLPVADLTSALPFYETAFGFRVISRADMPHKSAVLGRDRMRIGLAENGGDPAQDGCAFHVSNLDVLFAEFTTKGLQLSAPAVEQRDGVSWNVFYVIAPDGLCYWFGERQA
jgi:predicted enzyme related to lactoylglutathione lyase